MRRPDFTNLDGNSLRVALKQTLSFVFRSRIARFSIQLMFAVSLLCSLASPSLGQESCDSEGDVTIAYKGIMCALVPYTITLNGTVANGPGDGCVMVAASTPKTFTKLKLNKTYKMTAGSAICVTTINFQVPDGYTLYIDGKESNQIYKSDTLHHAFSGDGEWDIVVRKNCDCGPNKVSKGFTKRGSVLWQSGMGMLSDGRSAYSLRVAEKSLSAAIYTPSALVYSAPGLTSDVDVVKGGDGNLRQVKAPQALADVIVISASEYEIRYYCPADVGAKTNGIYGVSGQPFVTWRFKNPDTSSTTKLLIQQIENGSVVDQSEYVWEPITDAWTLSSGWTPATGIYSRIDSSVVSHPATNLRTVINTIKDNTGKIASKTAKTYQTFPWGEELVLEIDDTDVSALTTAYDFYTDFIDESSYGQLKSIKRADGSWEKYEYNDVDWTISRILRPWKDLTLEAATPENSRVTLYQYASHDGYQFYAYFKFLSGIQEQIQGTVISNKTFTRWSADNGVPITVNGQPVVREEQRDYASASLSQVTTTTRYYKTATPFLANRIVDQEYSDGRKDTYAYEKGNYVPNIDPALSQFIPNANGVAERQIVTYGTVASPAGIAFRTMQETIVRDQYGNPVLHESYVYNGTGYERITWTAMEYDVRGHLLTTRNHNGQTTTAVWTGERKSSEIDAGGVEFVYEYDSLGHLTKQTKKGIAAAGGFPAQADIVTSYEYDAEGRQTKETQGEGAGSLITSREYDKAGRLKKETDPASLVVNYSYTNGGRIKTTTNPGGANLISERYLDGQSKSETGSAVVARYFDYGANSDGVFTSEFVGSAGLNSPRWTKITRDWLGRTIITEKPSFTGNSVKETSIYDSLGHLQKQTVVSNATRLVADRLYEYDELGDQIRAGSDVDNSGSLTPLSTDRLIETSSVYEKVSNDWFRTTSTKTYLTDNNDTAITRTQRDRLNNFTLNGTEQLVSEVVVTDVAGNQTRTTTAIDRAAKKRIITIDTPDSNLDAVGVSVNGLLQSSTANTPQTATTYAYDGMGRQISVTDPRSGTTSKVFNSKGQVATTTGVGTTTYEYYPATHVNAGRLKSQENAASKKVYFAYNSRGELTETWGDTTYPLQYVYDTYGQRTELHTFRGGQNWSAILWPSSATGTADVTRWIYQESTGLVTQKQDAALKGPAYTYDELGRIKTRVWARGITCTYGYDANTGELRTVTYSDSTPAVSFSYDRSGQQATITDAAGTHTRTFNLVGELQAEQIAGGILDGTGITAGFDSFLRRTSLQTNLGANTLSSQTYGYDATSRLETVTNGSQTATYSYHANSGLLNTTSFTGGTNIARTYDTRGRLENITNTPAAAPAQSYTYTNNNLNQRTRITREDGSYWSYVYNDRGEVVSGKKYWSDNSLVWGAQTEYNFDNIGNLNYARQGGNQLGALRQSTFTANSLNRYSQRTVTGAVDVTGTAQTAATVTVNNQSTVRKGDYFYKELAVDNSAAPAYADVNILGARNNFGPGGEDATTEKGGKVFLPKNAEAFTYDDDGNLLTDGRWVYNWDAENRLLSMEAVASVPAAANRRVEFSYDYSGRRIQKKSYSWNNTTSSYELATVSRFINDSWNLVVELDGTNNVRRTYIWGRDISGTLHGAGGTGGLLLVNDGAEVHQVGFDGNGNVVALTKASTGTNSASYEYDPFGNSIRTTGEYAATNPFRFSTKYLDVETGNIYFGVRYYNSQTAKWISRDPLEESGGVNLYAFVRNSAIGNFDPIGLTHRSDIAIDRLDYTCRCGWVDWSHVAPDGNGANPRQLWQGITANRGEESLTKKGYGVAYEQSFNVLNRRFDGVWRKYFVRYGLSKEEQVLVFLSIVKEVSEQFENLQSSFPYWPLTNSGFSQEDLVSDLLGANMAILNIQDQNVVREWCRDVPNYIAEDIWDKTGGLKQIKTWEPIYEHLKIQDDKSCCRDKKEPTPHWPDQLRKIQSIPKGELYRDWTLKVDWIYRYSGEPYMLY